MSIIAWIVLGLGAGLLAREGSVHQDQQPS